MNTGDGRAINISHYYSEKNDSKGETKTKFKYTSANEYGNTHTY